jgi:hypothetical protein
MRNLGLGRKVKFGFSGLGSVLHNTGGMYKVKTSPGQHFEEFLSDPP